MKLLLLGTLGCHLCEEAEIIVNACLLTEPDVQIELIDIAEQEHWQQGYATLIPVLLHEKTAKSLLWPFTQNDAINFFRTIKL
jgi:fumarate hydratase, class II